MKHSTRKTTLLLTILAMTLVTTGSTMARPPSMRYSTAPRPAPSPMPGPSAWGGRILKFGTRGGLNYLGGEAIRRGFESRGYVCPPKPWYAPVPGPLWYGGTCAPRAY